MCASVFYKKKMQELVKGCGIVAQDAINVFANLKQKSETQIINTYSNIYASVNVLDTLRNASQTQQSKLTGSMVTVSIGSYFHTKFAMLLKKNYVNSYSLSLNIFCQFQDFVKSTSNLLNNTLLNTWKPPVLNSNFTLAVKYLKTFEDVVKQISVDTDNQTFSESNVELMICNETDERCRKTFKFELSNKTSGKIYQSKIMNLPTLLPDYNNSTTTEYILSVVSSNQANQTISIDFPNRRLPNHRMFCVYFDFNISNWNDQGCTWGGANNPNNCICNHLSAFTSLMSRTPEEIPSLDILTYIGLGVSIISLFLCLVIEFVVWNTVVKSNIAHFRHTVLVNLALCLLVAHCSFLAASSPIDTSQWCLSFTVIKHFCFLAAFFWMLCMSMGLLHQLIFVFVQLRKKVYLGLCFSLGYVIPLVIVMCTVVTYDNGAVQSYYTNETCWLIYDGVLQGSIHAFVIPVGIIVLVNMFTMVVVITRILKPTLSEGKSHDEKEIIRSVIRTVVLLTPSLGLTWVFGFFVLTIDLTLSPFAEIVNYGFTFFNSFQVRINHPLHHSLL